MKKASEQKNIKYGVILSYISLFISILGTLLVSNRILNYIGDYNYGLYSFVQSITSWISVVSGALTASFLRFSTIESKESGGDVSKTNTLYFKLLLILGSAVLLIGLTLISFLLVFKVNLFKYSWLDSEMMYYVFIFSIFNIAITMPTSIFSLYVTFKKRFIFGKIVNILITILTFLGNFLIALFTKNIILLSIFSIAITIITFCINFIYCKSALKISFKKTLLKDNKNLITGIAVFSSILLLNTIVDQINSNMDKTLLGIYSIPENITIYQMGHRFAVYLVAMSTSVSSVFAPTINQLVIDDDEIGINNLFLKISHIQMLVICLVVFGFCSCGDSFILWWLGEKRFAAYYVACGLMFINICPLTFNSSIEIQRARNKHLFRAITYIIVAVLNVGLSILFLNVFPENKAIFACLLGSIIAVTISHWILMNIYNKKVMKLPIIRYFLILLKYILIGCISFAGVYLFNKYIFANYIEKNLLLMLIKGSLFVVLFAILVFAVDYKFIVSLIKRLFNKEKKENANES